METIAVTKQQAVDLLAAATRRAAKTQKRKRKGGRGGVHGAAAYFAHIEGNVPTKTNTGSACAGHQLVRVVRGLRKSAGITHKSMGRVKFKVYKGGDKDDDGLAAAYPRGVACYMKWRPGVLAPSAPSMNAGRPSVIPRATIPRSKMLINPRRRAAALGAPRVGLAELTEFAGTFPEVEPGVPQYSPEDIQAWFARENTEITLNAYEGALARQTKARRFLRRNRVPRQVA
jgi:hypothetical protein